jgi:hypothetical protein
MFRPAVYIICAKSPTGGFDHIFPFFSGYDISDYTLKYVFGNHGADVGIISRTPLPALSRESVWELRRNRWVVAVTYQTVTPESAENGDFADSGYEVEPHITDLETILYYSDNYGCYENYSGEWWESYPETDYVNGWEITHALHVTPIDGSLFRGDQPRWQRIDRLIQQLHRR